VLGEIHWRRYRGPLGPLAASAWGVAGLAVFAMYVPTASPLKLIVSVPLAVMVMCLVCCWLCAAPIEFVVHDNGVMERYALFGRREFTADGVSRIDINRRRRRGVIRHGPERTILPYPGRDGVVERQIERIVASNPSIEVRDAHRSASND
jgi:hypothetical protein